MNIVSTNNIAGTATSFTPTNEFNYPYSIERLNKILEDTAKKIEKLEENKLSYRLKYIKMTGNPLNRDAIMSFTALEDSFGINAVRNMVEYMRVSKPGNNWSERSFFAYLLKALQNQRAEANSEYSHTKQDDYITKITNTARRNTRIFAAQAAVNKIMGSTSASSSG